MGDSTFNTLATIFVHNFSITAPTENLFDQTGTPQARVTPGIPHIIKSIARASDTACDCDLQNEKSFVYNWHTTVAPAGIQLAP
ncbi:hypothetical protein [Stutzerimonas urumqiensis]|uniref:hypothetical protein n=1 Tax=Stutzerimonas urumqiensis TaxID=638269 RepID=UPI0013CEE2A8|nr:hypothetical protein [Stutzerimonas urumqiensis]